MEKRDLHPNDNLDVRRANSAECVVDRPRVVRAVASETVDWVSDLRAKVWDYRWVANATLREL